MKRYDHADGGMDIEPDGEYVRYEEASARIAELEDEVAMLIHPHDLAAYRAKKSLHK